MLTGWVNESDYTSTGRDDLSNSDVNALRYFRSGGQQMNGWRYMASPDDAEENWYYFKEWPRITPHPIKQRRPADTE